MLGNLRALFGVMLDIALLRRGPESLPASTALMAGAIALYLALAAILTSMVPNAPSLLALQFVVGTIVTLVCFDAAFRVSQKRERFVQTMTGIFGVGALFLPALLPLEIAMLPFVAKSDPQNPPPSALFILTGIIEVWFIVVQVRIVRAAFEWPWYVAIAFFLAVRFAGALVSLLLFGAAPKTV
jgi:hypothetical protein